MQDLNKVDCIFLISKNFYNAKQNSEDKTYLNYLFLSY